MEGRSLFDVGQLLGHTSLTATQIYSHLTDDHLRDIAEINFGPVDLEG
jgi:site-specific recombinase XerD